MRGPGFIGVGTQRSGTTWWFELLLEHPQIVTARSGKKELHYFQRFCMREMREADVDAYRAAFQPEPGQIAGEWTPRYVHDFWTAPLLKRAAPDAKLLVLLRDPIERFRSGVPHRAIMEDTQRIDTYMGDAIDRGRYATQLRRLLHWHARENVLVLQYERCVQEPEREYERTLRFLGADAGFAPDTFAIPRGVSQADAKEPLWPELEAALRATLEPEVAELSAMDLGIDMSLWPNFRHLDRVAV